MKLVFQSGSDIIKLDIDRINKKLKVANDQTNYSLISRPYYELFGDKKEWRGNVILATIEEMKQDMKKKELLSDDDFKKLIVMEMNKAGYELKN